MRGPRGLDLETVVAGEAEVLGVEDRRGAGLCASTAVLQLSTITSRGTPPSRSKARWWQASHHSCDWLNVNSTWSQRLCAKTMTKEKQVVVVVVEINSSQPVALQPHLAPVLASFLSYFLFSFRRK